MFMSRGMLASRVLRRAAMDFRSVPAIVCASLLLSLGVSGKALAQDFYKDKTFTLVIGSSPGGGTDTTARLVARYWAEHIPGKPDLVVRNKSVNVIAANDLHHSTRPDGLTVAAFAGAGSLGPYIRKSASVKYDPLQWGLIGSIERGASILMIRKTALPRLTDPQAKPVAVGSVSTDRPQDAMALFGAEKLGWNIKVVLGYPGSNDMYLAFERGEIDMFGSGTTKIIKRFLGSGEAVPLAADAPRADFSDVPTFEQAMGEKMPTGTELKSYRSWAGPSAVDKYFAAPPGVPDALLKILRDSFKATVEDPRFVAQAEATLGDFRPLSGAEVRAIIEDILVIAPEVVTVSNGLRKKYGLPLITNLK
jgi:tripartite-type tricarboxylate transporter receptor subunit TctC